MGGVGTQSGSHDAPRRSHSGSQYLSPPAPLHTQKKFGNLCFTSPSYYVAMNFYSDFFTVRLYSTTFEKQIHMMLSTRSKKKRLENAFNRLQRERERENDVIVTQVAIWTAEIIPTLHLLHQDFFFFSFCFLKD